LVDTITARHNLSLTGTWEVLVPQRVIDSDKDDVAVAVTLFALRDGADIHALLLVQRNVLPSASGFGAPATCADGAQQSLTVYRSPRDVLCGWAQTVSFSAPGNRAHMGAVLQAGLADGASDFARRTANWKWIGLRVSNRNDFLDIQLLVPDQPEIPAETTKAFLQDMAHSMNATWLTGALTAVPPPVEAKPVAAAPTGSWWSGTLSQSTMKTMTYRVLVTVKTFLVASFMAGNAATGGAIITVLNFTSTGIYLMNDYIWETWHPLTPPAQNFASLVETP
jgi:uncharacterized membrane protein